MTIRHKPSSTKRKNWRAEKSYWLLSNLSYRPPRVIFRIRDFQYISGSENTKKLLGKSNSPKYPAKHQLKKTIYTKKMRLDTAYPFLNSFFTFNHLAFSKTSFVAQNK